MRFILREVDEKSGVYRADTELTAAEANFLINFAIESLIQTGLLSIQISKAAINEAQEGSIPVIEPEEGQEVDPGLYTDKSNLKMH